MFRPLELFIGLRYTRAKRRNHFISFISLISIAGIALGVTALITVLSVMNGFEQELREGILRMAAHVTIESRGNGAANDWNTLVQTARRHPAVRGAAPFISAEVMLNRDEQVSGALVRGIVPEHESEVSVVGAYMVAGRLEDLRPGEYGIVLGRELAWLLDVSLGDPVTVITPQANPTPAGMLPRLRRFTVVGIFNIGMYEYDRGIALMHMQDAARLFRVEDGASGVRLKIDDLMAAPAIAHEIAATMPNTVVVSDWTRQHANFFKAINTEKRVMFVILTLIVAVGAFNIVSTLVMVVSDKRADIAILRTLGATPGSIMQVFIVQGFLIGLLGTICGLVGGIALASNVETIVPAIERAFNVRFLSPDVYLISELPSKLDLSDVWRTGVIAFLLSLVATLYPAWRASRTQPAEALRYE